MVNKKQILFSCSSKHSGSFEIKNENIYIFANELLRFDTSLTNQFMSTTFSNTTNICTFILRPNIIQTTNDAG
jgi:hypothetical protein